MKLHHPFHFDRSGRTAQADHDAHIRGMIEQLLFTVPGERVNRPDFGTGLLQLVFEPTSDELATATQFTVQGTLQQWLGSLIVVEEVRIESTDSKLVVHVRYIVQRDGARRTDTFAREVPAA